MSPPNSLAAVLVGFPSVLAAQGMPSVTVGRSEARQAAERELTKEIYHRDDPSLFVRLLMQLGEWAGRLFEEASRVAPGGWAGLAAILALLVIIVAAIRLRVGAVGRSHARGEPLFEGRTRTADEYRAEAGRYAADQQWAAALRERVRAIARGLEERAILEPRPGRTAAELAAEGGAVLPAYAADLQAATRLFDDVWYGGYAADPDAYDRVRDLDERLRGAKPALAGSGR